jgi:hypothetical protein
MKKKKLTEQHLYPREYGALSALFGRGDAEDASQVSFA